MAEQVDPPGGVQARKRSFGTRQLRWLWSMLKATTKAFIPSDPFGQAGAIAYSTVFALPAAIIITLVVASVFYDPTEVRRALYDQAGSLIGHDTAAQLEDIVEHARHEVHSVWARVLGIVTLVLSATSVFASVQSSFNRIWQVKPKPRKAILNYLIIRLSSLALLASFGFLLLVSLVVDAGLVAFSARLTRLLSDPAVIVIATLNMLISLCVVGVVFGLLFKLLPDAQVKWRHVRSGALLTAVLFTLGKYLIGLYIGTAGIGNAYGAAGALIVILVWVYYSAVILLFGAQFTYQVALNDSADIRPTEFAVPAPGAQ